MKDDKPTAREDFEKIGRGILRSLLGDVRAFAVGAVVGGITGYLLGGQFGSYVWIGLLAGGGVALLGRSTFKPLFDFKDPPADDDTRR